MGVDKKQPNHRYDFMMSMHYKLEFPYKFSDICMCIKLKVKSKMGA